MARKGERSSKKYPRVLVDPFLECKVKGSPGQIAYRPRQYCSLEVISDKTTVHSGAKRGTDVDGGEST